MLDPVTPARDPDRLVAPGDIADAAPALPGFSLAVAALFEGFGP